jgi:hypothetical protein
VRIVTSLCVYWDRVFAALDDQRLPDPFGIAGFSAKSHNAIASMESFSASVSELALSSADLHYRGFSQPIVDAHHLRPDNFDYAQKLAEAPWNPFTGRYTRYGPVEDLVSAPDDRLVVMAAGDELTLTFDAAKLPALRPGWRRDYFLYARGYAKDGEPNTADFRTSDPLPFYRMSNYPYEPGERGQADPALQEYLREYETRPGYELIPRLASAGR